MEGAGEIVLRIRLCCLSGEHQ